MTLKSKIISIYLGFGFLFALYAWSFGETAHKSFAYNLGKGIVWPAVIFPEFGKAIGAIIMLIVVMLIVLFGSRK